MISHLSNGKFSFEIARSEGVKLCYILLPSGLGSQIGNWAEEAARRFGCTIVTVGGIDWNDDLTPWPAEGVFRKAKPFGGNAQDFLRELSDVQIPWLEEQIGIPSERMVLGISLSGLFAVWAAHRSNLFSSAISISGSLWYDAFAEWTLSNGLNPSVKKVYLSLGDREKNSKDRRMCTVEDCTRAIAKRLEDQKTADVTMVIESDTTHFSPIVPRLELAFETINKN